MNCIVTWRRLKGIIVCLWLLAVMGLPVKAQDNAPLPETKITVALQNASVAVLLQKIEQLSSYTFTYNKAEAEQLHIGTISWKDSPLKSILKYVKDKFNASFTIEGNNIAVKFPATRGRVAGIVLEESTGNPISGATITVGDQSTVSDPSGNYMVSVPTGTYSLSISSVGYHGKKIADVLVADNKSTLLNIALSINSGELQEVVVATTVKRESVVSLYARQKNAPGISDGISSEQIGRTPDKNIGESLRRVSGVSVVDNRYVVVRGLSERYNQAIMNGQIMPSTELNRKQFSFDIIPTNIVDNIVVYKTITPDQSAEFGGGSVEVNTKSIPTENFLIVSAGTSFNDQTTGKAFRSPQIEGREYFGQAAKHRYLLGSLDWKNTKDVAAKYESLGSKASSFSNNWGVYKMTAPLSQNYQASLGRVIPLANDRKIGVIASFSYRNTFQTQYVRMSRDGFEGSLDNDGLAAFKGNNYGFTTNLGSLVGIGYSDKSNKISLQSLLLRTLDQQFIIGAGNHADPSGYLMGYYDLATQTSLWQNQLKGEHSLGKKGIKLNWSGSYLLLDRQRPDNHQLLSYVPEKVDAATIDKYYVQAPFSSGTSGGTLRWWTRAKESNLSWDANIAIPFKFSVGEKLVTNILKTGYAGWSKDRLFFVLNTASGGANSEYYPPIEVVFDPARGSNVSITRFGDDFNRTASLHAGFLMLDHKIGKKWRLVWGARGEYYNLNKVNAALDATFKEINDSRGVNDKFDFSALYSREKNMNFFPSANLTYGLSSKMNLRVAYAKSIIRPDLRELSFFNEYDFELGGNYNSGLIRSTMIDHYDFRYEWYPGPGEVVSFSLFYKKLHYPMEIYKEANRQFFIRNSKEADNRGLEVEVRKSFGFTNVPVLRNIMLYGNFTMLRGHVTPMVFNFNLVDPNNPLKVVPEEVSQPEEKRLQSGASNYLYNAALYYDTKPLALSLSYNYITNRMYRPTVRYAESLYERPLQSLDAQVVVRFLKQRLELKLNASNLLNSYSLVYSNRYTDLDVSNGNKAPSVSQLLYQNNQDMIDYESRPGRTYSAIITYHF